jgi:uncharacterized protein YcbK (DUF882 family)
MMDRRAFLLGAGAVSALCGIAPEAQAYANVPPGAAWRDVDPVLDLVGANTGDALKVRFHGPEGYDLDALALVNWFMRDWREDSIRTVDVDLLWGLASLRERFMRDGHDGAIWMFSAYRTRRTNQHLRDKGYRAARNSFHLEARAVDFALPGVRTRSVAEAARSLPLGGVGYYPRSGFVHIDTGPVRSWTG